MIAEAKNKNDLDPGSGKYEGKQKGKLSERAYFKRWEVNRNDGYSVKMVWNFMGFWTFKIFSTLINFDNLNIKKFKITEICL